MVFNPYMAGTGGGDNPYTMGYTGQPMTMTPGWNVRPSQMLDFSGIPGLGGPMGMMLQMVLQPVLQNMAGAAGFTPFQFAPTQGAFDHLTATHYFRQKQQVISQVAMDSDKETYFRMLKGVSHLTGTPFGQPQELAARAMAGDIAKITPFLANMMPEVLDTWSGSRGSAQVMANFMSQGARYARDPVTGLTGMTGESVRDMVNRSMTMMDEPNFFMKTKGLTAGRFGQLYDEMQRRGLMTGTMSMTDMVREGKLPLAVAENFDALAAKDPSVAGKVREINADQVKERLTNLAGAVSAMKDIFGDMGNPNAPMSQIINGLQALTQGGLATMSPAQLETTVRRMHLVAKNSGMSMDAMMQLMASGAGHTDRLGLDRQFLPDITAGAAAFGQGFAAGGTGAFGAFGKKSRDQLTVMDQQLRAGAAASPQAGVLNAILAMDSSGAFADGSPLAKMANDIREGKMTTAISPGQFLQMAGAQGVGNERAYAALLNRNYNQEFGARYNTAALVRQMQGAEIRSVLGGQYGTAATNMLPDAIRAALGPEGQAAIGNAAAIALTSSDVSKGGVAEGDITNLDKGVRDTAMAKAVLGQLGDRAKLLGATPEEQIKNLMPVMNRFMGSVGQATGPGGPLQGYQNWQTIRQMYDPVTMAASERFRAETDANVQMQAAMAPFNQFTFLRRFSDSLQNMEPGTDLNTIIAEMAGAAPNDKIKDVINTKVKDVLGKKGGLSQLMQERNNILKMPPGDAKDIQMRKWLENIKNLTPQLYSAFSEAGFGDPLAMEAANEAARKKAKEDFVGPPDPNKIDKSTSSAKDVTSAAARGIQTVRFDGKPEVQLARESLDALMGKGSTNQMTIRLEKSEIEIIGGKPFISGTGKATTRGSVPNPTTERG